ncbi:MAG: glycosyltransferase [Saprospiraceae bacterium]
MGFNGRNFQNVVHFFVELSNLLSLTFDITIPVLNEAPTLVRQITILHEFISHYFPNLEQWKIVIADNGSTDATPKLGQQLTAQFSNVQFLKVPERGVGLALKTSWSQSKADIVGYMDLDLATDLSHFLETYQAIAKENFDLVYATRLHKKSQVINRSLKREISSRGFNFIVKNYLGTQFSDGMCGFKFLKRKYYDLLHAGGAQNNGWFFSTELLTVAEWKGLNIKELPVKWTDDVSSSRVQILPLAKRYLLAMRELKKERLQKRGAKS